ncbi:zinc finger protein 600-like [Hyposmocoma kahamanoa]|uniref:zinc finger protein 600-like n=1 Tax=Hyposmocoma kahamanoa TaxID=1477025 RepID=UPI000E6D67C8|nr:zinc finger protein 600-like [Hyposmocoma kahamanoa]
MERAESDRKSVKCEDEEETREREIQKCLNEFQDNCDDRDFVDEQEIDLEDVFKGLEEKQDSEIESLPDLPPRAPSPKRKKPNLKKLQVQTRMKTINYSKHATLLSKAMCNSRIRLLTIEEQKEKFNAKLQTPDFVRAPFKCAICLCTSFRSLEDLVIHLETYKSQSKKHICAICKRRYETEAQLTAHSAKMHWYEYVCNTCGKKCDTYYDIVYCFESHLKHGKMILNNAFIRLPLCNEAMYHTMDKYTGLKETIVKCTQCNIGFQKIKELTAHLSLHLSPQNATQQKQMFECDICHLMFTKRNKLSTHMKQWHLYSYTCNSCSDSFMNWQQVVYHMKHNICKVDKASKHMTCRFCNKVVKVKTYGGYKHMYLYHFTQHFNVHCNLCGESYESNFNLYRHQIAKHGYARINHHELGDPRYHCAHCKFFFADDKAFQEHVVRYGHDEVKDIPNGCTMCRQVFENVEQQRDHICKQPYGSRYKALYPKTCCYCDVQLSCHLEYSTHMHTVHRELTYMPLSGYDLCERCGKTVYKRGMESHIKLHHDTTVKSVSCRYCPDMFNNHTSAVSHMLTNHTHKPYLCAICPLRFKHRCEARDHILKVHTPVMLYYCSTCDRRFSHLDYLNDHSVKIHGTNIKGRSVYLPRRKARRIVVYPHMKIDCTLIDKEYLEKAEIEICDYMDENDKKLDNYLEYVVFNNAGETIVKAKKKKPYKYKKQKKTTNIIDNRNIMYVKNIKIPTGDNVPVTSRVNELTSICNDGSCDPHNTVEARQVEKALIEDVSQEDIDADDGVNDESMVEYINEDESMVDDVNEVLIENVNEETIGGHQEGVGGDIMEVDMLDDLYENHDVIDVAGCEYVMAGGTLYKIIRE